MNDHLKAVTALARDLVAIDSRSALSNLPVADRIEAELAGFEVERIDYDTAGVAKRALVARRGQGGLGLSGHMDTVPDTGWQENPWSACVDGDTLHGLGSTDMKGPLAAAIVAARALPLSVPITLLITTDEETTKAGARAIAERSQLARRGPPTGILVVEPTRLAPVRGHRAHIVFTATSTGVQAHSSTGRGRNANWELLAFLTDLRPVFDRLRNDPDVQDAAYDPPFSDFNVVIDNHGTAVNVTVPRATARIKYRFSAGIDPGWVSEAIRAAADRHGLALDIEAEGAPPELPADHPLVQLASRVRGVAPTTAPYGTDASELQSIAPCLVMGPGDIAVAHTATESVSLAALAEAVPVFMRLAEELG